MVLYFMQELVGIVFKIRLQLGANTISTSTSGEFQLYLIREV